MPARLVSSLIAPELPQSDGPYDAMDLVLIDMHCYIADLPNATTATGTTSTGLSIQATFRAARPPVLSHICVHCPGLEFRRAPKVVATDAHLVLLCVPVHPDRTTGMRCWDYFVYDPRANLLDLLPNPYPRFVDHSSTALISREGGSSFVVAALGSGFPVYAPNGDGLIKLDFDLHLYNPSNSERWISKRISVSDPLRDKVAPLPDSIADKMYHENQKTITVDRECSTVAWVDLWRGIFLCDVLAESPVLQDIPLPLPARGNWVFLLEEYDPRYFRDVTISRGKGCIKYVEMEIQSTEVLNTTPVSYIEWVCHNSKSNAVLNSCSVRTWSLAVPFGSWEDWQPCFEVDTKDITVEARQCPSNMLSVLSSGSTLLSLSELPLAYPTLSMNDDIVYLLSRLEPRNRKLEVLFAIDMKERTPQGVEELDVQKNYIFMPSYCISEICIHLRETSGTIKVLKQAEKVALKQTGSGEGEPGKKEEYEAVQGHAKEVASGEEDDWQCIDQVKAYLRRILNATGNPRSFERLRRADALPAPSNGS